MGYTINAWAQFLGVVLFLLFSCSSPESQAIDDHANFKESDTKSDDAYLKLAMEKYKKSFIENCERELGSQFKHLVGEEAVLAASLVEDICGCFMEKGQEIFSDERVSTFLTTIEKLKNEEEIRSASKAFIDSISNEIYLTYTDECIMY
jgi:5'-deoxynucleotidase YfbR-like HD superfamily hydrolase